MKSPLFNRLYALALGTSILLSACSKEDEEDNIQPTTDLEEVKLSFTEETEATAIEVPEAMASSDNQYAQIAVGYVNSVNQIGSYFAYFEPPAGAVKSNEPIIPANGRMAATKKEYLVYTWSADNHTIAYQLSDEGDKYVWEIFWKVGEGSFSRYLYAEESKTIKKGKLEVYGLETNNELVFTYEWEKKSDGVFILAGYVPSSDAQYTVTVNPNASGSVEYFLRGDLFYLMEWTGEGSGTWAYYLDGQVTKGSWTA